MEIPEGERQDSEIWRKEAEGVWEGDGSSLDSEGRCGIDNYVIVQLYLILRHCAGHKIYAQRKPSHANSRAPAGQIFLQSSRPRRGAPANRQTRTRAAAPAGAAPMLHSPRRAQHPLHLAPAISIFPARVGSSWIQ